MRWKNLLSTGNAFTEIVLTDSPTTLILGENGSGKSTMLDALCFSLFGRPYRDINKPQILNSVNGKQCVAEVEFSIGKKEYKIVRGIKPSIFEIFVNGELLNQDANSRDYQKYLEESILKLDFKSFTQIVILGSAGFTPFMQLPAASRRAIIEDILDIQIFTVMNTLLKSKVKETVDIHTQLGRDVDLAKQKTLLQEKYIKTLEEDNTNRILDLQKQLVRNDKENAARLKELDSVLAEIEEHNQHKEVLDGFKNLYADRATALRDSSLLIKRLTNEINSFDLSKECPTCGQRIDISTKEQHVEERKTEVARLTVLHNTLVENCDRAQKKVNSFAEKEKYWEQTIERRNALRADIRSADTLLLTYQGQICQLEKKNGNIQDEKTKLKEYAKEVVSLSKKRTSVGEDKYYLEFAGTLLKDSGIKTRIIDQYLPVINKLVNKYLSEMDFYVLFTLDQEFKEVIKSRFRDEFTYASFSEGEKQRINLAILFTWRTIAKMKNSASTNLLILDEVFDSSLDTTATEYVMGLLQTVSKDSHVFVISHKADALIDKFSRTLRFEKKQNFSTMEIE